jgi:pilus assembly protein Flp/PilA
MFSPPRRWLISPRPETEPPREVSVGLPAECSGIDQTGILGMAPPPRARESSPAKAARTLRMSTFIHNLRSLAHDERGVTALEYGLIAGLIAVVIVTAVTNLGTQLVTTFTAIATALP